MIILGEMMDEHGFATAELIFVTLIVLLILMGMMSLVSNEMDKTQVGNIGQARMLGENVAEAINTVYANGPGYSIRLNIPNNLNVKISINNSTDSAVVYILNNQNTTVNQMTIKLIPSNLQDKTLYSGSNYTIKNVNGTISFTP